MKISEELSFICDENEYSGVKKIAEKVCNDVLLVLGFCPKVDSNLQESVSLIFGTIGKSKLVEDICKKNNLSLSKLQDKNESYGFFVKDNKIIIVGSDKRGTIYGLFHFSDLLGVSPLVNWADVFPEKKDFIELNEQEFISKEPSVKFRGFFINDEWPAYGNWTSKRFGGFNSEMYENVFELLLRMKGNYLWPAMWSARFSDDGPGLKNAELADELGVIMGASHHEPCCRAGEEYRYLRGKDSVYGDAWNFRSNEEGITKFWEDGLKRNGKFENVITVGMRGEADTAIMQNATLKDNIDLLRDVISTQNKLIKQYVNDDLQKVPRMLALYKEVEPYFYGDKHTKGLMNDPVLDGVTLMLCDDNHGNLRTVPTEKMRNHNGGYGMYYHFDYHGSPFSYEWINSTALPKVKEQMTAAYDFGIQDLWIVNVGDIMTNEFPLNYFLDLAYDYEKYSSEDYTTQKWTSEWIKKNFPTLTIIQQNDVEFILNTYTKLAHMRRPECISPDTYHPINFGESDTILQLAEKVIATAAKLYLDLVEPSSQAAKVVLGQCENNCDATGTDLSVSKSSSNTGLFAQVIYPAMGTMNVLRMQLYSGKNRWYASKGALVANEYAEMVKKCLKFDEILVKEYDQIANGKFYAMGWSEHFGFNNWCEAENSYPTYVYVEPTRKGRFIVFAEGDEKTTTGQDWTDRVLHVDTFKNPDVKTVAVYVANSFNSEVPYNVSLRNGEKESFIDFNIQKCTVGYENNELPQLEKIVLTINREKLASSSDKTETLIITANDGHGANLKVCVEIDANVPDCNYPSKTYIQTEKYLSISAENFAKRIDGKDCSDFRVLPDYGKTSAAVKSYPVTKNYSKGNGAPCVEYHFVPAEEGIYNFDFYLNPSNPAFKDNKMQFIAEINGQKILKDVVDSDFAVGDHQEPWSTDVTNNIRISTVFGDCKAGLNVLRLYPVTPNVVLEKIVIYKANTKLPYSYLGAPETYKIK